ncbi:uncharacterized protein LOC126841508 [Adelges cooleyi]|uniref:uncharacterized protein LOC126841508 n=1 Tax=Adelges cooleyi TaxID=133065 RepID=UPI00217F4036|nr:uncharacterized protein LOC126841508 [Adelges cooleyi]
MLCSKLSLWFGLTTTMLIICMLAYNVETKKNKLHMGILETRGQYISVIKLERIQSVAEGSSYEIDYESFQRLQCSYALSSLRHLLLTEEFLYKSKEEFMYNPDYDYKDIVFDSEAALMLATLQSMPFRSPVSEEYHWTLLFYTISVHRLLEAFSKDEVIDPLNTQFMYKAHESIVDSLREFVIKMEKFQDVQEKLQKIVMENIFVGNELPELIYSNKDLLNRQIRFNEVYGVSGDGIRHISFDSLTNLDKVDKIEDIFSEYFGEGYWTIVKKAFEDMYDTAKNVETTVSYRTTHIWHINNGIMKVLKLILIKFIESYLHSSSKEKNVEEIKTNDRIMHSKLSEFRNYVGDETLLTGMFNDRYNTPDFYNAVKRDINLKKNVYPICSKCTDNLNEKIFYFYTLLLDENNMKMSSLIEEWTNIEFFLVEVQDFFSDVNMVVAKSFYAYPFYSNSLRSLKEKEHPNGCKSFQSC